jgi:lipopolysaccharide heptosyltransferase II
MQPLKMKILIRLPNWLGDVVMSTAFVAAVQQLYPGSEIDVIIKKELSGIAGLIPGLNHIHSFSKQEYPGLNGVFRFGKTLRPEKYDLFFCLPDSLSSAVMGWATGAKQRIGFGKEGRFFLLSKSYKKPANIHRTDEYISLLEQFTGKTISERKVRLEVKDTEPQENTILVNFNSEAVSRRMPVDKGRHLVNTLTNSFKTNRFILVGSPKEKEYVDELLNGAENRERLENNAGKTNLKELCALMASAKAVLTTDSGPAHLANALGIPTIVLFGAGNELNTAPYNKEFLTVLRAGKLDCEPCVRNTCKLYGIPKCMELLDELEIINSLRKYLPLG